MVFLAENISEAVMVLFSPFGKGAKNLGKFLLVGAVCSVPFVNAELELAEDDELELVHAQGLILENEIDGDQQMVKVGMESVLETYITLGETILGGDTPTSRGTNADVHVNQLIIGDEDTGDPLVMDNPYQQIIVNNSTGQPVLEELRIGFGLLNGEVSMPEGAQSISGSLTMLDTMANDGSTGTIEGHRINSIPFPDENSPIQLPLALLNELKFTNAEGVYLYLAQGGADLPGFGIVIPEQANGGTVEGTMHEPDLSEPPPLPEPCPPPQPPWGC